MSTATQTTEPLADLLVKWQAERERRGAPPLPRPADPIEELRREREEDQPSWRRAA
jgi:hypothetical protein